MCDLGPYGYALIAAAVAAGVLLVYLAYYMAQHPDEVSDALAGDPSFQTMLYRIVLGWWYGDLDADRIRTASIYGYIGGGAVMVFVVIVFVVNVATTHCPPPLTIPG